MMSQFKFSLLSIVLSSLIHTAYATVECKGYDGKKLIVKPKTITIYNNSSSNIYPVISTSKNSVNQWLQACLRTNTPYPTNYVYKLYINEHQGLGPGQAVTVTLPLFSKLSSTQFITWWNGGRVVLADRNDNLRNAKDKSIKLPTDVTCAGKGCQLSVYSSDVQFPENIYAQLSEFTFGDSIIPPTQSLRLLKPENVGYNISYVDHVYMPIAIAPKNNPYIGYSGSTSNLAQFRAHLMSFLQTDLGLGWPVYNLSELKLPGGYNIFAQRSGTLPPNEDAPVKPKQGFPPVLTVLNCIEGKCNEQQKRSLHFGQSVQRIQNLWGSCVTWNENLSKYVTQKIVCPDDLKLKLGVLQQFFAENHRTYVALINSGQCSVTKPIPFDFWQAINHIYGWVPFNEGCGAAANPLANTKISGWDHAKIQAMYIHDLQYNYKDTHITAPLLFNPYVKLIHAANYLAMDAYGFSVDDAVGFMSELGDGLIFTVGGSKGLVNKQKFNYADGFSVAIGVPQPLVNNINVPLIKKYGVCAFNKNSKDPKCVNVLQNMMMPTNSQIAGFRIGNVASYPIKVNFTDAHDNLYSFTVNSKFAPCPANVDPSTCPTNKASIVNKKTCIVKTKVNKKHPKSDAWCQNANPNQSREQQITKNYISFPQPVDYMP